MAGVKIPGLRWEEDFLHPVDAMETLDKKKAPGRKLVEDLKKAGAGGTNPVPWYYGVDGRPRYDPIED